MKTKRQQALITIFTAAAILAGICGGVQKIYGAGSVPALVRDIYDGPESGVQPLWFEDGDALVNLNGVLFFGARYGSGVTDYGLFKSDGTAGGTIPVKDGINPKSLICINNTLYFTTFNDEVWTSDGTSTGTRFLVDSIHAYGLAGINDTLFFCGDDGVHGNELWKSDGTMGGTTLVKDIYSGVTGSVLDFRPFVVMNNLLYFTAASDDIEFKLWQSDGTAAGTTPVALNDPDATMGPVSTTNINGVLYYTNLFNGDLWRSDGTDSGTTKLAEGIYAYYMTYADNKVFFCAGIDWFTNDELWVTDGTASGTGRIKDICSGDASSDPQNLINVNNTLYFSADDGIHGRQLWKSDGTASGTIMVKQINVNGDGIGGRGGLGLPYFINMNGTLYFRADDGVHGGELWKSDGTESGTAMVADICSGVTGSVPSHLTDINGTLYFMAYDDEHGYELWKYTPDSDNSGNSGSSGGGGGGGGGCFVGIVHSWSNIWLLILGLVMTAAACARRKSL